MAYEHKPGQGSLFKNDKKESDKHPNYKGTANIDGVTMDVAAWVKEGAKGKYMSLSIKPKQTKTPADQDAYQEEAPPF